MTGKLQGTLAFRQIAAHTGGKRCALDEPSHFLVIQAAGADGFSLAIKRVQAD